MLVCDTSALIAYFDGDDASHSEVAAAVDADPGPFIVSPYVVAELDYLVATRRGVREELSTLAELAGGAWDLATFGSEDVRRACRVIERYADQRIGVADASIVVLADRHRTTRVLTLDRRHFDVVRTLSGHPFELVPSPPR